MLKSKEAMNVTVGKKYARTRREKEREFYDKTLFINKIEKKNKKAKRRHKTPPNSLIIRLIVLLMIVDINIVRNEKLRDLLRKGPKYREIVSFSWPQNFDIIMDAREAYARRWAKKEDVELNTLSDRIESIDDVLKRRIRRLKYSVSTRHESLLMTLMLSQGFPVSMRTLS